MTILFFIKLFSHDNNKLLLLRTAFNYYFNLTYAGNWKLLIFHNNNYFCYFTVTLLPRVVYKSIAAIYRYPSALCNLYYFTRYHCLFRDTIFYGKIIHAMVSYQYFCATLQLFNVPTERWVLSALVTPKQFQSNPIFHSLLPP